MFSAPGDCVLSCICNHSAAVHSSVAVCGPRLAAPMRAQPSGVVLIMAPDAGRAEDTGLGTWLMGVSPCKSRMDVAADNEFLHMDGVPHDGPV